MTKIELTFACNPNKTYYPVLGSSFTDTFNEQLDNCTIALDHIVESDRLINIKPYDYVKIVAKEGINTKINKLMLVNSFFEKEINILEHIYSYQITLMSETKWLEKIQLPNLTITHKINSDGSVNKQTIYDYISHYMDLYVPKIKIQKERYVVQANTPYYNSASNQTITFGTTVSVQSGQVGTNPLNPNRDLRNCIIEINQYGTIIGYAYYRNGWVIKNSVSAISSIYLFGEYKPMITYPTSGEFYDKFNVSCADMGTSARTLREVLSFLMQQVSCIPIVKNRVLSFLDFKAPQSDFVIDENNANEFNYIQRSLSSDSYVNTLVTPSSQVLDSENVVVSENVGFRDINNVLVKKKQNLKIQTKFPIYKINKFELVLRSGFSQIIPRFSTSIPDYYDWYPKDYPFIGIATDSVNHRIWSSWEKDDAHLKCYINRFKVVWKDGNDLSPNLGEITIDKTTIMSATQIGIETGFENTFSKSNSGKICEISTPDIFDDGVNFIVFKIEYWVGSDEHKNDIIFLDKRNSKIAGMESLIVPYPNSDYTSGNYAYCYRTFYFNGFSEEAHFYKKVDMTPIVKENQERSLLNTNFNEFVSLIANNRATLEQISQYIYGTIGYSINGKEISGFSDTFTDGEGTIAGWVQKEYTYWECIKKILARQLINDDGGKSEYLDFLVKDWKQYYISKIQQQFSIPVTENSILYTDCLVSGLLDINNNNNSEALMTFNIEYQPLNSYSLSYVKKEDIPIPIEQYHSGGDAISDFDRLSTSTQQIVDKVGQETINISQRTTDWAHIKPLNSKYGDYTIFNRRIEMNNFHYNITYTASKNAVLRDYFTSIRTKYRAYQNVDYSQSTTRKERDLIYVYIGKKTLNFDFFDEKVNLANNNYMQYFFDGIKNTEYNPKNALTYVVESDGTQYVKNDVSVVTTDNIIAAIYEQPDNISLGTYFKSQYVDENVGGLVQEWQKWDNYDNYNKKHSIYFAKDFLFFEKFLMEKPNQYSAEFFYKLPILSNSLKTRAMENNIFSIVTNKNKDASNRYFYKDNADKINHTIEFIYYTDDTSEIEWTELFLKNSTLVQNSPCFPNALFCVNENYDFSSDGHSPYKWVNGQKIYGIKSMFNKAAIENNIKIDGNKIIVHYENMTIPNETTHIVVCNKTGTTNPILRDFIKFKVPADRTSTQTYYVAFNDTKTFRSFQDKDGLLILE